MKKSAKHTEYFTSDPKYRFALVASLAAVDGGIGEKEKILLNVIGEDYRLDEQEINDIVEKCNDIAENKIVEVDFVNEILTNVPEDDIEKLKDLSKCYKIVLADEQVTQAERNAFDIICRFYGVRKEFFTENKEYEDIIERKKEKKYYPYLTERDSSNRVRIKGDGYDKIRSVFLSNEIKGPLLNGIKYALEKRYNEVIRNKRRNEKKSIIFAFTIFCFSAFTLLLNINTISHQSYVSAKINQDISNTLEEINKIYTIRIDSAIKDSLSYYLGNRLCENYKKKTIVQVVNHNNHEKTDTGEVSRWKTVSKICRIYIGNLKDLCDQILNSENNIHYLNYNHEGSKFIILSIALVVFAILSFRPLRIVILKLQVKFQNNPLKIILLGGFLLLVASGKYANTILLLYTMLSIEWLILMKGNNHNEKGNSTPLTILVIMAIISDISFGMIELEQYYTLYLIFDKIFSALFLGCICFFFGKFLELQYYQGEENRKTMKTLLDEIKNTNQ